MVEGNGVWRTAAKLRLLLLKRRLRVASPNESFVLGAEALDGMVLCSVEALGKNLFLTFLPTSTAKGSVAPPSQMSVQLHFGMSGGFTLFRKRDDPGPRETSRIRLECEATGVVGYMSGIRCKLLDIGSLASAKATIGPDPLRCDADANRFWRALQGSKRPIGVVLMDQKCISGIGNIYRAEILHRLRLHPMRPAGTLLRKEFESLWKECVTFLRLGCESGVIITVLDEEWASLQDVRAGMHVKKDKSSRRWVYFRKSCLACAGNVSSWVIGGRDCFACERCQKPWVGADCASLDSEIQESTDQLLRGGPPSVKLDICKNEVERMTVKSIRSVLNQHLLPPEGRKNELVARLLALFQFHRDTYYKLLLEVSPSVSQPWPAEVGATLAELHCWCNPDTIHTWAQAKGRRYGRGSANSLSVLQMWQECKDMPETGSGKKANVDTVGHDMISSHRTKVKRVTTTGMPVSRDRRAECASIRPDMEKGPGSTVKPFLRLKRFSDCMGLAEDEGSASLCNGRKHMKVDITVPQARGAVR